MEALNDVNNGKKRSRDDSDLDSPLETQVLNSETTDSVLLPEVKKAKNESEPELDDSDRVDSVSSPQIEHFPEDILEILDEPDQETAIEELDLVMKSFEEEILHSSPSQPAPAAPVGGSDSGESQTDLEYLLEASDDELGLPPTESPSSGQTKKAEETETVEGGLGDIFGFGDEFPSYDSFDFGEGPTQCENGEFAMGGLFDYDPTDFSEFLYRPESLQAQ